ncbi:hypothetical protein ACGFMO_09640 [Streptomyces niveus]
MKRVRGLAVAVATGAALLLTGCGVPTDYSESYSPLPERDEK